MKSIIIGIDIGASRTKAVGLDTSRIFAMKALTNVNSNMAKNAIDVVLQTANRQKNDVTRIALVGGGARLVGASVLGLPVTKVDEIDAIGFGGLHLSGKSKALIVSMGTGTALVTASEGGRKIEHIGGSGVGGGTIEGLARRILGIDDFKDIEIMANKGQASKVNLTVADIAGDSVGIVPGEATASNFQKLNADTDENDIAAAIFDMVSEVIGVILVMAAKAYHLENDIVLVGKLIQSQKIAAQINAVTKMFNMQPLIPINGEYCVALGAALALAS